MNISENVSGTTTSTCPLCQSECVKLPSNNPWLDREDHQCTDCGNTNTIYNV